MKTEFIEANGIRFHCKTDGDGPLVLLLHGFPQFWYTYRHLIPALAAAGYRAVAPDMRGYGETTRPKRIRDYGLRILGNDIAALIHALREEKAHVMGHDWGGAVAWETAMTHPEVVDRLIVVNCPPAPAMIRALRSNFRQLRKSWYVFMFALPRLPEWLLTQNHGEMLATELTSSANTPEEIAVYRDAITRPGAAWAGLAYYRAVFLDVRTDARRVRGRKVASPTLVLWGEQDPALGKELTEDFDRYVSGPMQIQLFPDVGHWLIEDRPADVARLVIDFLDEDKSSR